MTQMEMLPRPEPPVRLNDRQKLALACIAQRQPIMSDALGAYLHADRLRRGGRGHAEDAGCDWCASEGSGMGKALERKGVVRYIRGNGWVLIDYQPPAPPDEKPSLQTDVIPF